MPIRKEKASPKIAAGIFRKLIAESMADYPDPQLDMIEYTDRNN